MFIKFFFSFVLILVCVFADAQTYTLNGASNNSTITTCSGTFYDSGGADNNYQNTEDYTITFCSSNGGALNFYFDYFDIELNWDEMSVYDGSSVASPEILGSPFTNNDLAGSNISSSGPCITFNFDSDGSITRPGWMAIISCLIPCQNVQGNLTVVNPEPNATSGAVEICQGEGIDFTAEGIYLENDDFYSQSDATSTFDWDFGDGSSAVGATVNHIFSNEGIFNVTLTITDINGCQNTDVITQLVYVSTTPNFTGTNMEEVEICLGSQNVLNGFVNPVTSSITCDNVDAGLVSLPDGSDVSYNSEITLDCYGSGVTLSDINDLEGICLNMEHSYVGDLEIEIICPNNQSVILLDYPNGGFGTYLGEPIDIEAQPNDPGIGYDYCFTTNATNGNLASDLPGTSQPAGNYSSDESLTGLIGCPLNGDWTIVITDNIGADNGFLFSWEININSSLLQSEVEFTPSVVTETWITDPSIISATGGSIIVEPTEIGNACYTYEIIDDFGCAYDTTLCFDVLESSSDLQIDPVPVLCESESVYFISSNAIAGTWTGDVNPDGSFDPAIGPGSYTGTLTLGTGTTCEVSESVNITVNPSPSAFLSGSSYICSGDSALLQIDFTGSAPWTFEYAINGIDEGVLTTSENPYLFYEDLPGAYTMVSVSDPSCIGTMSGSADIIITDSPQISNVIETCAPDLLTYTISFDIAGGDVSTYSVLGSGTLTGSTFTSDPIVNGTGYDFTISDVNNCGTDNINGSYNCGCAATAVISGTEGMCTGANATLTIDFEGVGPWTFNYTLEGVLEGTITTSDNPHSLMVAAPGSYALLDVEDVNCVGSVSGSAEVFLLEIPQVSNIVETCVADLLTYTISFDIAGGDVSTYSVLGSGTLTGSTFTSDPIVNGAGYDFTISDVNNCGIESVSGSYNCGCLATATISGDIGLCDGVDGLLEINFEGLGPWTFSYSINDIDQGFETVNENLYFLPVSVPGTYEITSIEDSYCVGEVFGIANVIETTAPNANFIEDISFCSGAIGVLEIEFTGQGPWDFVYAISGVDQDIISSSADTISIDCVEEGIYTISLLTDQNCATTSLSSATVTVHELPQAMIDGSMTICENEPGFISVELSGTPDFNLIYAFDGIPQDPVYPTVAGTFALPVEETGIYELLTLEDAYCTGTVEGTTTVDIAALPTAEISGEFTICDGQQQLIPIILTGSAEWTINYTIDGFDQTPIVASSESFNLPSVASGIYEITTIEDNYCTNDGMGFAEISYYPPIEISFSADASACVGEVATVWASASGGIGSPYSYNWVADNLTMINDTLVDILLDESASVTLTVADQCEYSSTTNIPVVIHQLPPVSIDGEQNYCGPEFIQINNTTPTTFVGESCLWIINEDSIFDCNSSIDYYFSEPGLYNVSLAVTSPEGCYNSVDFNNYFEVFPTPNADFIFGPNDPDIINPEVHFTNESSEDVLINTWTFGDENLSTETSPSFIFPTEDGPDNWLVCLTVENDYGCLDSLCEMVIIKPGLLSHIPNSFSPDGDGLNELFFPVLNGVDEDEYEFRIYDRIGDVVFKTNDINGKWNGSNMGKKDYFAKDGFYNWQITAKLIGSTDKKTISGTVLMLR